MSTQRPSGRVTQPLPSGKNTEPTLTAPQVLHQIWPGAMGANGMMIWVAMGTKFFVKTIIEIS